MMNSDRILKAIKFAEKRHKGQKRKSTGIDYICHPIYVSYLMARFKKSKKLEDLIVAAILHDTVEDTKTTFAEIEKLFGIFVATLVFEVTNDKKEISQIGKVEYQKKKLCGISSYGLTLKLCDMLGNIHDKPTDRTVRNIDEIINNNQLPIRKIRVFSKYDKKRYRFLMELFDLSLNTDKFKKDFGVPITLGLIPEMLFFFHLDILKKKYKI